MSTSPPTTTLERIRRATPSRYDALIAVVAWLLDVSLFAQTLVAGPAAILYSILTGAVIAWRRSAPLAVFAIVCLCTLLGALAFPEYWPFAGLLVALYTVATSTRLAIALPALIAAFLLRAPLGVLQEWGDNPEDPKTPVGIAVAGLYAVIISGTWLLGRWSHRSRARIHELVQREQDVTEAVRAERRKLAHELHDIVSHSVSVMVLQARGARRVLDDDPPRADEALGNIERVGKQSMVELRRLLGVLEAPPDPGRRHGCHRRRTATRPRRPPDPPRSHAAQWPDRPTRRAGRTRQPRPQRRPVRLPHRAGVSDQQRQVRRP